jgi:hypothetical protein
MSVVSRIATVAREPSGKVDARSGCRLQAASSAAARRDREAWCEGMA